MHAPPPLPLLRALLALALLALCLQGARRVARALLDAPDDASEAAATVTVAGAALTLGFNVLTALGAFSLPGCAAVLALVALAGRAVDPGPAPRASRSPWDPFVVAVAALTALVGGARWLRASVSPALAPDSMTYHLYRAARWVQLGHDAPEDWPDAAGYYEFFPAGGDVFWGYGFALTGEDLCVASVGMLLWVACGVAAFGLARAYEVPHRRAALATLAVMSAPAALSVSTSGYVDAWTLATFVLAATHLRRALTAGCAGSLALTALAAALHLGTKLSGVPAALAFGAGALALALRDPRSTREHMRRFAIGAAIGLLIAAPGMLRATLARGSPLYPMAVGGPLPLPGNAQLAALLEGRFSRAPAPDLATIARAFTVGLRGFEADPMGWGVAWVAAVPLSALAMTRARRQRPALALDLMTLALALAGAVAMASPAARELRTSFLPFSPRLLLAVPAVLTLIASRVGGPGLDVLWAALALANLGLARPPVTSPAVRDAALAALPWALAAGAVVAVAWRLSQRAAARAGAFALAAVVAFAGVRDARARHRASILAAMAGPRFDRSYEVNPVGGAMRVVWRAGDALTRDCARRTAVAFGWAPPGHRIFRYPLMGDGWTNQLTYVPVTEGGEVIDLADEAALAPRRAPARWYARLIERRVDHVVTTPPHPPELSWMLARPDLFEPIADEAAPMGVFRVRAVHRCPR